MPPLAQCLTCQRLRKKRCPGITNNTGPCEECARLHLECLLPEPGPFSGRPAWFSDEPRLLQCRDEIKDWTTARRPREADEILCLSEILDSTSLAPSAHLPGHATGPENGEGSIQHTQVPSTVEAPQTIETSVQFALPTISYLISTYLPQVRELILVLDDTADEDDEAAFQNALEESSLGGRLGGPSFRVQRGK